MKIQVKNDKGDILSTTKLDDYEFYDCDTRGDMTTITVVRKMVSFSRETLKRFKEVYEKTPKAKSFSFEGNLYVKEYAKYLIEYLENRFNSEEGKSDMSKM